MSQFQVHCGTKVLVFKWSERFAFAKKKREKKKYSKRKAKKRKQLAQGEGPDV